MELGRIVCYQEAIAYIDEIPKFTKKNGFDTSKEFYAFLQKPANNCTIFHVAGTNGKGSVCAYLDSICREAGLKTGLFTSPHLVDIRERFRLQGEWISQEDFLDCFQIVANQVLAFRETEGHEEYHPTFFEYLFFMAMLYFEKKQVQVLVLETGLGGRLDTTNVIDHPAVSVITEIGMDHMEYLGNSIAEIAAEKAGIIKAGCPVVYVDKRPESSAVIEQIAAEKNSPCKGVSKSAIKFIGFQNKVIDFSYQCGYDNNILSLQTTAFYQMENAATAVTALLESGLEVSMDTIKKGLFQCKWEGRMEEILPQVFLDGAHNVDGIDAFLEGVERDHFTGKRYLLFSAVADKEVNLMKEKLVSSGLFSGFMTAPLESSRGVKKEDLQKLFRDMEIQIFDCPENGLEYFLQNRNGDCRLYIVGSLYLVGQIKEYLLRQSS